MKGTSYRISQTGSCPYCESEGPFIKMLNVLIEEDPVRTYLECLVCGNTFIRMDVAHPSFTLGQLSMICEGCNSCEEEEVSSAKNSDT